VPIAWGLTATTIAAVAAVGLAGPACACEPFDGTYSLDNSGCLYRREIASFVVRRDVVSQVAQSCDCDADGASHCSFQLFSAVALLQADECGGKGCAHD
jgi:hypothetical protein